MGLYSTIWLPCPLCQTVVDRERTWVCNPLFGCHVHYVKLLLIEDMGLYSTIWLPCSLCQTVVDRGHGFVFHYLVAMSTMSNCC